MTYKEIVDKIESIVRRHEIIREFGYGTLSDLKTLNTEFNALTVDSQYQESLTLYPYVFLNPTQSTRTSQAITYRFNMIVMDTVLDNGLELRPNPQDIDQKDPPYGQVLQVQSDCQQYIDDIIAGLRFGVTGTGGTTDGRYDPLVDVQLTINLTPFRERFQDTVAGMTASLEIMIAQPINKCIAPYPEQ